MVEKAGVYDKNGNQIGGAANLGEGLIKGWEWWAVASGTISTAPEVKKSENFYGSAAVLMQLAGNIKGYGESSSFSFAPLGVTLTATTPAVASVDILPGAKITFDSVKEEISTNKAYLNSILKVKLSDAKARQAMSTAKAALADAKSLRVKLKSGALDAQVAQVIQSP